MDVEETHRQQQEDVPSALLCCALSCFLGLSMIFGIGLVRLSVGALYFSQAHAAYGLPEPPHLSALCTLPACPAPGLWHLGHGDTCIDNCGHVSSNLSIFLANGHGSLVALPNHSAVPVECRGIEVNDTVTWGTTETSACSSFCKSALGPQQLHWLAPLCEDRVHWLCFKVGVAAAVQSNTYTRALTWMLPLVYSVVVIAAFCCALHRSTSNSITHPQVRESGFTEPADDGLIPGTPWHCVHSCLASTCRCLPQRPFTPSWLSCCPPWPLPWFKVQSDADRERRVIVRESLQLILDPVLDVYTVMQYLHAGQPLYAVLTCAGFLADPFSLRLARVIASSWRDGFRGRPFLVHQLVEGTSEGWIGSSIALVAFIRAPVKNTPLLTFATLALNFVFGFILTVPSGLHAQHVLSRLGSQSDGFEEVRAVMVKEAKDQWKHYLFSLGLWGYTSLAATAAAHMEDSSSGSVLLWIAVFMQPLQVIFRDLATRLRCLTFVPLTFVALVAGFVEMTIIITVWVVAFVYRASILHTITRRIINLHESFEASGLLSSSCLMESTQLIVWLGPMTLYPAIFLWAQFCYGSTHGSDEDDSTQPLRAAAPAE